MQQLEPEPAHVRQVTRLGLQLRIADGLDRSHMARIASIASIQPRVLPDRIDFEIRGTAPFDLEMAAAQKKGGLARKVFGRETVFLPQRFWDKP